MLFNFLGTDVGTEDGAIASPAAADVPPHIVTRWLKNFEGLQPDSYWLTRIVLLRAVAFIFG